MTGAIRVTSSGAPRLRNGVAALMMPSSAPAIRALATGLNGQSNMVHELVEGSQGLTTNTLAQESHDGVRSVVIAQDPTGFYPPGTSYYGANGYGNNPANIVRGGTSVGDAVAYFVNHVTAATNIPIVFYGYASIGTSIEQWVDSTPTSGDGIGSGLWTAFANAVKADPGGAGLNSAIWRQAENNLGTPKDVYKAAMRRLHNLYLALAGMTGRPQDFYFGIDLMGPSNGYGGYPVTGNDCAVIRQAQLEYIAENIGAHLAASSTDSSLTDTVPNKYNGDGGIHISQASWERLALRDAKSLAAWAKGSGAGAQGPKIVGAVRTGIYVDVTVQHSGGTVLKDGAGGAGSSAMGFRFFDKWSPIACTPVGITGPNTIRMMLASAPAGVLTMDHAMANLPYGVTVDPKTVIYDNDTVPGDTIGLPLQPCAPITVTGS